MGVQRLAIGAMVLAAAAVTPMLAGAAPALPTGDQSSGLGAPLGQFLNTPTTATPIPIRTSTPGTTLGTPGTTIGTPGTTLGTPGISVGTPVVGGTPTPVTGVTSGRTALLLLTATMDGAAEVPGPGETGGLGSAAVTVDTAQNQVCYALHAVNIGTPTAAHIHEGAVGVAGPVVVPLDPPVNENSNGCVTPTDAGVVARLASNPTGFYVNVHDADYPDGAIRGQLGR